MTRVLLAALVSLLGLPSVAAGATVTSREDICGKGCAIPVLELRAAPGEVNDVVLEPAGSVLVIRDRVPLRDATDRCEQLDAMRLRCTSSAVEAELGDGDDRFRGRASVDAGDGDDTVEDAEGARGGAGDDQLAGRYLDGGTGDDVLRGGPHADLLSGGPGRDTVQANGGDDRLADGGNGPEADLFDGGEGVDLVSYSLRPDDLGVDLAADASTDGDALVGVEGAQGGRGNDRLVGDEGPNALDGGGGQDILVGAGGPDRLDGNAGYDRLDAGSGDDQLFASSADALVEAPNGGLVPTGDEPDQKADADAERLSCGTGFDVVRTIDDDFVLPDCELLRYGIRPYALRVRGESIRVFVPCARIHRVKRRCRGTLTVRSADDGNDSGYEGESGRARFVAGRSGRWVRVLKPVGSAYSISLRFGTFRTTWRIRSIT